jgi:hypothetical protein
MSIDDVRRTIKQLIDDYIPEQPGIIVAGSQGFDHIAKDYGGSGTTCGFLPHWLLWRLGCTDKIRVNGQVRTLVNRDEPDAEYVYHNEHNLVHFLVSAALTPATVRGMKAGTLPKMGDIVLVTADANQPAQAKMPGENATAQDKQAWADWVAWNNKAHVFVFLDKDGGDPTLWKYAESGFPVMTSSYGKTVKKEAAVRSSYRASRKVNLQGAHPTCNIEGDNRRIHGWVSLDKLSFASTPPVATAADVLKPYTLRATLPQPTQVIGKWRVRWTHRVAGHVEFEYHYHLHKGSRAFYTMADKPVPFQIQGSNTPQQFLGDGFWVNDNGLKVIWPDSSCEEELTLKIDRATSKMTAAGLTPGYRIDATKL